MTSRTVGWAVVAEHPDHSTYLCLNAGSTFFGSFQAARDWIGPLQRPAGSKWRYSVVEVRTVESLP